MRLIAEQASVLATTLEARGTLGESTRCRIARERQYERVKTAEVVREGESRDTGPAAGKVAGPFPNGSTPPVCLSAAGFAGISVNGQVRCGRGNVAAPIVPSRRCPLAAGAARPDWPGRSGLATPRAVADDGVGMNYLPHFGARPVKRRCRVHAGSCDLAAADAGTPGPGRRRADGPRDPAVRHGKLRRRRAADEGLLRLRRGRPSGGRVPATVSTWTGDRGATSSTTQRTTTRGSCRTGAAIAGSSPLARGLASKGDSGP